MGSPRRTTAIWSCRSGRWPAPDASGPSKAASGHSKATDSLVRLPPAVFGLDSRSIGSARGHRGRGWGVGAAAGGTFALALLVFGCVFAAIAGPAISLHLRT